MRNFLRGLCAWSVVLLCVLAAIPASVSAAGDYKQLARDILKELIEINTTDSVGSTTKAAEAMAARLKAAGFPDSDVRVLGPNPRKGNLVARLRGAGAGRPVLLLAHLDVVEARRSDWSFDPFTFLEREGYFYGRGTSDDKAMAAIWVTNLIRMRHEGLKPNRDIIVALTADEEGGDFNGAKWLVENHRHLVDAEFCLNEGGGGEMKDGRRLINEVQASEKVYLSFRLEVTNPGGHSSLPTPDNAIYHLAEGLARLAKFDYPVEMNEVTRNFFQRASVLESGQVAADMRAVAAASPDLEAAARLAAHSAYYNAQMRTTCVATMLEAGQAANALPQRARAVVNCRLLPGSEPQTIQQVLVRVLADDKISVTPIQPAKPSPPSPLRPEILGPIERITAQMWPGVPVVATMCTGATDGLYFRQAGIPTYGVSGLFEDIDDVRAHGRDERVGVKQFYESLDFLYRLVKAFVS